MNLETSESTIESTSEGVLSPAECAKQVAEHAKKGLKMGILECISELNEADQFIKSLQYKIGHYAELCKAADVLLLNIENTVTLIAARQKEQGLNKGESPVVEGQKTNLPGQLQVKHDLMERARKNCGLKFHKWQYILQVASSLRDDIAARQPQ
jgi:hypothetical protein